MFRLILPYECDTLVLQGLASLLGGLRPEWSFELLAGESQSVVDFLPRVEHVGSGRWLAILEGHAEAQRVASALDSGAAAVVLQSSSLGDLEMALETLLDPTATYAPPDVVRKLAARAVGERTGPLRSRNGPSLSDRESQILALIAEGDTNGQVALKLGISVNTVRTHIQAISNKLNVSGRINLAGMAWRSEGSGHGVPPGQT